MAEHFARGETFILKLSFRSYLGESIHSFESELTRNFTNFANYKYSTHSFRPPIADWSSRGDSTQSSARKKKFIFIINVKLNDK